MANLVVEGRLGSCKKTQDGKFLRIGILETMDSYQKKDSNEWVTPWFNILLSAERDQKAVEFFEKNAEKIDCIKLELTESQYSKDGQTKTAYHLNRRGVISWKKANQQANTVPAVEAETNVEVTPDDSPIGEDWEDMFN